MQVRLLQATCLLAFSFAAPSCLAGDRARVSILVWDYAQVPAAEMDAALQCASSLLQHAGIDVDWIHPNMSREGPPRYLPPGALVLNILPQKMVRLNRFCRCLGYAIVPGDGTDGSIANILDHEVRGFASDHSVRFGKTLGHAIAHEIGHLLLDNNSHSAAGLMKSPWLIQEVKLLQQGLLHFMSAEALQMRRNLLKRQSHAPGAAPEAALTASTPARSDR